ncbi:tobamovirus multiplication protein 2A isoform X2 [Physcomitrium patens]|uniref:tobamovirus multiplication protein 2A isoform X2 n=1 Tax=Physcomitrium patens TaxID=3218 RepID=UPI000D16784A|nr:tobamovirus multiplication protein 2A-like isoform X2 [Physcomitrium patens]|eukprot:XP_024367638.1 tobamovirus multiplication protein 2A-like isoform X2 [Physcomitrella patens]
MSCQGFIQCILKLINFLVTLVGALMIVYSLWMLKEWSSFGPHDQETLVNAPALLSGGDISMSSDGVQLTEGFMVEPIARPLLKEGLYISKLPAPWFIYAFFGAGAITCFVSLTGHIAADFPERKLQYSVLQILLLLAQFAVAGALFFDRHWREDIPEDPTGELDKVQEFVLNNLDICKWVSLGVVVLEALGLFFAFILRSISSSARRDYDSDEDYMVARSAPRRPVVDRQANQPPPASGSGAATEARPPRSDAWSTRMREKYGLDTTEFSSNSPDMRRLPNQTPGAEEQQSRCIIM